MGGGGMGGGGMAQPMGHQSGVDGFQQRQNRFNQNDPNSPTGPMLGPGSELRRLYNMPTTMGHASAVQCMAMVDGKVYTGGRDSQLMIWQGAKPNGRDFELTQDSPPINLSSSITSMVYEPTSKWLFLGCWRGEIQAFCKEPVRDCRLEGHHKNVSAMTIHSSVVISGSQDATVRLWTANPQAGNFQACGQALANPTGPVNSVKVFNDSLWVGAEQGITCFDLNTLQAKGNIPSQAGCTSLFNFQGYMIAAFNNGEVKIFDAAGQQVHVHPPQGEHTSNTAVEVMTHPITQKPMLLCGQQFGYVTAYDLPDFRPRGTFVSRNNSDIRAIVDCQADGMFLTAGQHGDIMCWQWQQPGSGQPAGGMGGGMGGGGGHVAVAANPFAPSGGAGAMAGAPMAAASPFAAAPGAGGFAGGGAFGGGMAF